MSVSGPNVHGPNCLCSRLEIQLINQWGEWSISNPELPKVLLTWDTWLHLCLDGFSPGNPYVQVPGNTTVVSTALPKTWNGSFPLIPFGAVRPRHLASASPTRDSESWQSSGGSNSRAEGWAEESEACHRCRKDEDTWHAEWHSHKQTLAVAYSYTEETPMCKMSCYASVKTLARAHTRMHVRALDRAYSWAYIQGVPFRKAGFHCFPGVRCFRARVCARTHVWKSAPAPSLKEPCGYQDAVALRYDMLIKCVKMSGTLSLSL